MNRQVRAAGEVNLRDAPPAGLFYRSGRVIGTVRAGPRLLVLEERPVRTLFRHHLWIRVRRMSVSDSGPREAWAYEGEMGKRGYLEPIP